MCWHKWTEWKTYERGKATFVLGGGDCHYEYQRRECTKCKKVELNKQIA